MKVRKTISIEYELWEHLKAVADSLNIPVSTYISMLCSTAEIEIVRLDR